MAEEVDRFDDLLASFAKMTEADLRYELRRWCWNALAVKDDFNRYKNGTRFQHDDAIIKLGRVQGLVDVRRKTLKMGDLIEALREPSEDPEATS